MRARLLTVFLVAGAVALAGGCAEEPTRDVASLETTSAAAPDGDGQSSGTGNQALSEEDFKKAIERYQQCLRDNGFTGGSGAASGEGGEGPLITIDPNAPGAQGGGDLAAAQEKCREFMPNGGVMPTSDPEVMDKVREWTKCVREKGLEVIDNGRGSPQVGVPEGDTEARRKLDECDQQIYGGTR